MQVKLKLWPFLVLAAILLQCAYPSLSLPKGNSSELNSTESNYLKWVKHMGFVGSYKKHSHSQLRKSGKKKKYRKWKKNPCKRTIKVNKNDLREGDFVSIQEAINSLPLINTCRVVISVSSGTYKEKVVIPPTMGYVTVRGQGAENTVIEWDDTADKLSKSGKPMGTFGSATFAVTSTNFIAKNITFKNTAPAPHSGTLGKQAVAMRVSGDKAAFIGCHFIGAQDTLYDHKGRHYFKECYIQGSIDFIFGNGLSIYEDCHLHAAANNSYGALTAQKRGSMLEETGFSFVNCKITGSGVLYLGRAWGTFSRVIFAYTYMDKIIIPTGWYDWGDKNRDMTVFYGQYKCSGPGAEYGARVAWSRELTTNEVAPFVSVDFIDGYEWLRKSWSKLA